LPKTKTTPATPAAPPPVAPAPAPAAAAPNQPPPLVTGGGKSTSSTGATRSTKVDLEAQFQAVIAGLLAYYQPADPFLMADGTYTRDQLIARFQAFVSAVEQTKGDYQIWRTDVASEQALLTQVRPLRAGVRGIVQARFGKQGPQVLQFGFTPVKTAVRTAASKALAAQKAAATRKARGTVGKKAKSDIHGTVPTAPAAAPAAPAPAEPAPAPATPAVAAPAPTPPATNTPQH
jgi:predicted RNA-binding Zn ribbon-like protein